MAKKIKTEKVYIGGACVYDKARLEDIERRLQALESALATQQSEPTI